MALCKAPDKLYTVKQIDLSLMEGALMRSIYVLLFMIAYLFGLFILIIARKIIDLSGAWLTGQNGGRTEGGGGIWV